MEQLEVLLQFLQKWYGQPMPTSIPSIPNMPSCLRELFCSGWTPDLITTYNTLLGIEDLIHHGDRTVFYIECQGSSQWAYIGLEDNPSVCWTSDDGKSWHPEKEKLCGFLSQVCLHEAVHGAPYQLYQTTFLERETITNLLSEWSSCGLQPWSCYPTEFYFLNNVLGLLYTNDAGQCQFHCGAKQKSDLQFMDPYVAPGGWEVISMDE
jgi:hypothetical protein